MSNPRSKGFVPGAGTWGMSPAAARAFFLQSVDRLTAAKERFALHRADVAPRKLGVLKQLQTAVTVCWRVRQRAAHVLDAAYEREYERVRRERLTMLEDEHGTAAR